MKEETDTPISTRAFEISLDKTGVAKPPYKLAYKIPENIEVCAACKLPFGRIPFVDLKGEKFGVSTNTNAVKRPDGTVVHGNRLVCALAKDFTGLNDS